MRFYAACLASYNNGVLHGRWIEATPDADEMQAEINAMLRASRFPNVTVKDAEATVIAGGWYRTSATEPTDWRNDAPEFDGYVFATPQDICDEFNIEPMDVPSAEEWAVHDYDGIPPSFGEYPGLAKIAAWAEFVEENDDWNEEDLATLLSEFGTIEATKEALEDRYAGTYETFRDYAEEAADETIAAFTHNGKAPQILIDYFDYEAFARDLRMDMTTVDLSEGVAVFHA